jgi:hypothetical protein
MSYSTITGSCNTISNNYNGLCGINNSIGSYGCVVGSTTYTKDTYSENRDYLLDVFLKKLKITREDLHKDPSWIKAKVRDFHIDSIIG